MYNVKNTHGGVLNLVKLQTLKLTLLHGCFSRFLNCTNGTKSRNASQLVKRGFLKASFNLPKNLCLKMTVFLVLLVQTSGVSWRHFCMTRKYQFELAKRTWGGEKTSFWANTCSKSTMKNVFNLHLLRKNSKSLIFRFSNTK